LNYQEIKNLIGEYIGEFIGEVGAQGVKVKKLWWYLLVLSGS